MSIPPDVLLLFNKFLHYVIEFQVKFNVWLDIRETDEEVLYFLVPCILANKTQFTE